MSGQDLRCKPVARATLLYSAAPMLDETGLAQGLAACLGRRGRDGGRVETEHRRGLYVCLTTPSIEVLVSLMPDRVPADRFAGAARPANRLRADGHLQSLIEFHETCLTVTVRARGTGGDPVPAARLEALCEAVCHHLAAATGPEVVHFSSIDTLFAAEEFARRDPAIRPAAGLSIQPRPERIPRRRHDFLRAAPRVPGAAAAWFAGAEPLRPPPSRVVAGLELPRPKRVELDETAAGSAAVYVMNVTLILMAFPVGLAVLIYNLITGGSFVATGRAMGLTGVALAVTSKGMTGLI